jgi:hypothetical protein
MGNVLIARLYFSLKQAALIMFQSISAVLPWKGPGEKNRWTRVTMYDILGV